MGRYIAYKRRKIKRTKEDASTDGAPDPAVRGNETAMRREAARLEFERARAVKQARAVQRRMKRRELVVDRTTGRKRTAARARRWFCSDLGDCGHADAVTLQLIVIMRYLDRGAVFYLRIALQKLGGFTEGFPRI